MDSLQSAVVDITRLIATCRAVRNLDNPPARGHAKPRKQLLHAELRRAAAAYLKQLARARDGVVDEAALARCRMAAEQCMPTAIASVRELGILMDGNPGALDGLASGRHDLWRLARIAIHLREGSALLRGSGSNVGQASARKVAKSLQRQLRRALVAYANATVDEVGSSRRSVRSARKAAIGRLGPRCLDDAVGLAHVEAGLARSNGAIGVGVTQPLKDLLLDWGA